MSDLKMEKSAQRNYARSARKALGAGLAKRKSAAAISRILAHSEYRKSKIIMSYFAFSGELDVSFLEETAKADGKKICYPVCDGRGGMVAVIPFEGSLEIDRYGISEPKLHYSTIVPPEEIDLILVPGVAFDKQGGRIGYGAGYYDRFTPLAKNAFRMAMAFEEQLLDKIAIDPWDKRMNAIATDARIYEVSE